MERRGASHIEVILAFLLFIGAITSALYFFTPAYKSSVVDSTLSHSYNEVKDQITTDLSIYYIHSVSGQSTSSLLSTQFSEPIRVEDYSGKPLEFSSIGGVCIASSQDIAVIYASKDIDFSLISTVNSAPCSSSPRQASISSSISEKILSELKAENLKMQYEQDYAVLKQQLNIPQGRDFSFSLQFSSGEKIESQREIPNGINIFSKTEKLKVLRKDGKRDFADFIVKIW